MRIFTQRKFLLSLLLIFIITILAYGLTTQLYFWKDDFALMIKARYPDQVVGYYSKGFTGGTFGGYSYIPVLFELFFPYFGMNAMPYFVVGILFYFGAAVSVYYLALNIFKDKLLALCSGVIFAAGYVGADSIYGLTNSYQTSWIIIFISLLLIFLIKFYEQKKWFYYLLSVLFYFLCVLTGYVRAHGVILVVIASGLLVIRHWRWKEIGKFILLLIPYFYFFDIFYLQSVAGATNRSNFLINIIHGDLSFFTKSFATLAAVFFPYDVVQSLTNIFSAIFQKQYDMDTINLVIGILFIIANIILLFLIKSKEKKRIIVFSLIFVIGTYIAVYYIGAAASSLISTHRYLTIPLVGASIYWVVLLSLIKRKKVFYGLIGLIVVMNIILTNLYTLDSIKMRAGPQKKFFSQIQSYMPTIPKGTIVYFDVSNLNQAPTKFTNIFGVGMAGGSPEISSHYNIDRYDITSYYTFADFISGLQNMQSLKKAHTFYYENENLVDTTEQMKKLLQNKVKTNLTTKTYTATSQKNEDGTWDAQELEILVDKTIPTLTDSILRFNLRIKPLDLTDKDFITDKTDNSEYFSYLQDRKELKAETRITASNQFQDQVAENLLDDNPDTTWMANRGIWGQIIDKTTNLKLNLDLSLPVSQDIGGILFTNGNKMRTPTKLAIYANVNGNWKLVTNIIASDQASNAMFFVKIPSVNTDKIRIQILQSTSGDAPQLAEVELIPSQYANLDFNKAFALQLNPLSGVHSQTEYQSLLNAYSNFGTFKVTYYSSKDASYVTDPIVVPVQGLNDQYSYAVVIPAGGITLQKIAFQNLTLPATYTFSDLSIENMTLDEEKKLHKNVVQ